jgi:hypothetical protein
VSIARLAAGTALAGAVTIAPLSGPAQPADLPRPQLVVERMGVVMSESAARREIGFHPFAPPREIIAIAVLPPFAGADVRANRGVAYEYADENKRRYALAEWPADGGSIERFALLEPLEPDCRAARTFPRGTGPRGIVWSTSHGLILTLQTDGANDARTLRREWRRLIRRGVCGL